jgi:hypothetical protein
MTLQTGSVHLILVGGFCVAAWLVVTYLLPRLMLLPYKRAILKQGIDNGPVPVNTLYVQPQELFVNPFTPLPPGSSKLLSYGTNRDTLYVFGWLDLSVGPQVLQVPDMGGRYYSVQLTDPSKNTNFAYVGTRTTGTAAGGYLITGTGVAGADAGRDDADLLAEQRRTRRGSRLRGGRQRRPGGVRLGPEGHAHATGKLALLGEVAREQRAAVLGEDPAHHGGAVVEARVTYDVPQ